MLGWMSGRMLGSMSGRMFGPVSTHAQLPVQQSSASVAREACGERAAADRRDMSQCKQNLPTAGIS